ncbi:alpha/beta fold hydrolase [Pedobacter sp.]|nr:alpha/beta fold hydrolase [Candidatus Saccharibacteria bacterium]
MKNIICSHGFGVAADGRGMFPEIARAFPNDTFLMFDYNQILPNGDIVVSSLDEQATKLQDIINGQPSGSILLCHSQGCIIAGLVDLSKISHVILLAPPVKMSMQRVIDKIANRPGSEVHPDGLSRFLRSDGTVTLLSQNYVQSVNRRDPMKLYQTIANTTTTTIILATKDRVLGQTNIHEIQNVNHIAIDGDHDFEGNARLALIADLENIL